MLSLLSAVSLGERALVVMSWIDVALGMKQLVQVAAHKVHQRCTQPGSAW